MRDAFSIPSRGAPLHALTGSRFIAAFAVVLCHFADLLHLPDTFRHQGAAAVAFFFVLSGFVLTYNYAGRLNGGSRAEYLTFLRARVARVYPLHLLTLLLITPFSLYLLLHTPGQTFGAAENAKVAVGWLANVFLVHAFSNNLMAQNGWNGPAWSVSCELMFYIAFPFILLGIERLRSSRQMLATAAGIWLLSFVAVLLVTWAFVHVFHRSTAGALNMVYRGPYFRIADFAIGCLAGLWFVRGGRLQWTNRLSREIAIFGTLAVALVLTLLPLPLTLGCSVLFVPGFTVLVLALASGPSVVGDLMSTRPLIAAGEASFSLYLFHMMPLEMLSKWNPNAPAWMSLALIAACVAVSFALYHGVENPCRLMLRARSTTDDRGPMPIGIPLPTTKAA